MKLSVIFLGLVLACALSAAWADCPTGEDPSKHWHEKEMDTAWLTFVPNNETDAHNYYIRFVSHNCYKCAPTVEFIGNEARRVRISSQFPWAITLETKTKNLYNETLSEIVDLMDHKFQEYGHYKLIFKRGAPGGELRELEVITVSPGVFTYLPIIVALSICFTLALIVKLILVLMKRRRAAAVSDEVPSLAPKHNTKPRLRSLDAFRGFALFFMVFVNFGGGGYWFFDHATWNGITFADLLFPWFVWIMGAAMPFAMAAAEKKKEPRWKMMLSLIRRSLTLAALGMFLNNGHYINYWRLPGVLQRFGFAYFVIGSMYIFMPKFTAKKERPLLAESSSEADMNMNADYDTTGSHPPTLPEQDPLVAASINDHRSDLEGGAIGNRRHSRPVPRQTRSRLPSCCGDHFTDIYPHILEYLFIGVLILAWFLITFLMPVPGCPTGYLGPGGSTGHFNCTGGAAGYIDKKVFTLRHIYDGPTCSPQGPGDIPTNYGCGPYDPEGLLGNLTSIFLCYLGLQAGRIMKTYQTHRARFVRLLIHGLIWAAIGTGLCGASQNAGIVPLNKNLWSFSFVALLGGLAYWLLALFFLLIDWIRIWKGAPFTYVGMNSIVVYMGHEILQEFFPFSWSWRQPGTCAGEYTDHWTKMTSDLAGAAIWLLIAYVLFRKKIFIRV